MQGNNHIFQGLKRDTHQIRQSENFLWDAHNIRLTCREDNTMTSITNEKGTSSPLVTFDGMYVGHCVIGKYLVVFTAEEDTGYSWIYRIEKNSSGGYTKIILHKGNINLSPYHPIETLGYYETELIQKVYWIDDVNTPRVINVTLPELKFEKDSYDIIMVNDVDLSNPSNNNQDIERELEYYYPNGVWQDSSFDFIRKLRLKENISVNKIDVSGIFSPGTIQYAFTYYNKYEAESNIFYTTPLYYIAYKDRGANPEDKISCGFNINISNLDNYDYIRIYSIHRTSIDAVPTVKIVTDLSIKSLGRSSNIGKVVSYTDNGTSGSTIDPTYLLYLGGKDIVAKAITQKNGTLFLGNISLNRNTSIFKDIINEGNISFNNQLLRDIPKVQDSNTFYDYNNPINSVYTASFKSRETYRCGIQIQDKKGVWSEPIYLKDMVLCDNISNDKIGTKAVTINRTTVNTLINNGARKVRTCVVFPKTYERDRICQGILCPTVYNKGNRWSNIPYATSSWFFRPTCYRDIGNSYDKNKGEFIEFLHNKPLLGNGNGRGIEVQSMNYLYGKSNYGDLLSDNLLNSTCFFVDENIVTFHSPDIEFDTNIQNTSFENTHLEIVGIANLGATSGDVSIKTKTPVLTSGALGAIPFNIGSVLNDSYKYNGGLVAGAFYNDSSISINNDEIVNGATTDWIVHPWNRSGSLNNDIARGENKGTRSSVLEEKVISNLKFFSNNEYIEDPKIMQITTPTIFNSNEVSLLKIKVPYLGYKVNYYGNVDNMVVSKEKYPILKDGTTITSSSDEDTLTNEPVRIKYKSSPHIVFSLGEENDKITLLPRYKDSTLDNLNNTEFTLPSGLKQDYQYSKIGVLRSYGIGYYPDTYKAEELLEDRYYLWPHANNHNKFYLGKSVVIGYDKWVFPATLKDIPDNLFVKVVKGNTSKHQDYTIPGITSESWAQNQMDYIGETKYYKVVALEGKDANGYSLCKLEYVDSPSETINTRSSNSNTFTFKQETIDLGQGQVHPYLFIAELVREVPESIKFGGTSEEALRSNLWFPSSDSVTLNGGTNVVVPYTYGDTWYSRYDCLKTYPFTKEDENQVVEIGSFMCETRVNIDGRYDRNRGEASNLNMSPQNFNLINEVYSQKDNFFNYRIFDKDFHKQDTFTNQILWSKQKVNGEDIDTWTNVTLASSYDVDGDKGKITSLEVFNNTLLCFQEKALSQIGFNERVQIPTSDGTPIEISNNYKVDGHSVISSIGSQDKWNINSTPSGVYFIDYNSNSMYLYNGQLNNLGVTKGMTWWLRQNEWNKQWSPVFLEGCNGIRTFYDKKFSDIYFTPGPSDNDDEALCYSEYMQEFTSFMSYGGTQAMFNFDDGFYSLRGDFDNTILYQNNVGEYNNFYGELKDWSFSFIENNNPTYTKIFDTIEVEADIYQNKNLLNICPFNFIKVENEYQKASTFLNNKNMKKRFRVWRGLIPRASDTSHGNRVKYGRSRIRNPWAMITLSREIEDTDDTTKVVVHNISVKYTI